MRPSTLLRDLPAPRAWGEAAVLCAALGALFSALAATVMLVPGGFILGAALAAHYYRKTREAKQAAKDTEGSA